MQLKHLLVSALLVLAIPFYSSAQYEFFDYTGATQTWVTGINDLGDFVGYFDDGSDIKGFYVIGQDTGVLDYPTANVTYAYGISNSKKVVGKYNAFTGASETEGYIWDYYTSQYEDLTTPVISGGEHTQVLDINDNDCWAGNFRVSTTAKLMTQCIGGTFVQDWYNNKPTYGTCIDNVGLVGGYYIDGAYITSFIWTGANYNLIDHPNSIKTRVWGMNNDRIVVGDYNNTTGFIYDGYSQNGGSGAFEDISIDGAVTVHPQDINNENHICGYYTDGNGAAHGFFIREYDLVFRPHIDGWNFANDEALLWPYDAYNNYIYNIDPYLKEKYDIAQFFPSWETTLPNNPYPSSSFPSWPLFVETFGEEQAYEMVNGVRAMKPAAYNFWRGIRNDRWGGSCTGFSVTSLMAFDDASLFATNYPSLPNANVHSQSISPANRSALNRSQILQFSTFHSDFDWTAGNNSTSHNLNLIKGMMVDESMDDMAIGINNVSGVGEYGGHSLVPFKVERDETPGWELVYVYDSNYPNDTTRHIRVNKQANGGDGAWYYEASQNQQGVPQQWGGPGAKFGFHVNAPISTYAGTLEIGQIAMPGSSERNSGYVEAYFSPKAKELVTVGNASMGYSGNDFTWDINAGMPIADYNGTQSPPLGYMVDELSSFIATISNSDTNHVYMNVFGDGIVQGFSRNDAIATQQDELSFDGGITFTNPDTDEKNIDMFTFIDMNNTSYNFWLNDIPSEQNAEVHMEAINGNELIVTNTGGATHYQLTVSILSASDASMYVIDSVPFASDATHHIVPNWLDLANNGLYITVDTTTTGVDDTLFLDNQALPYILMSSQHLNLPSESGTDTVSVINAGGATLNWQVTESPSWITITAGNAGVDDEQIIFDYSENLGTPRSGWIVVNSNDPNAPDSILIEQGFVVGVNEFQSQTEVAIYPNPADELVMLKFSNLTENIQFRLFDLSGRVLQIADFNRIDKRTIGLNVSDISSGVYLLEIKTPDVQLTEKLIVR